MQSVRNAAMSPIIQSTRLLADAPERGARRALERRVEVEDARRILIDPKNRQAIHAAVQRLYVVRPTVTHRVRDREEVRHARFAAKRRSERERRMISVYFSNRTIALDYA